MEANELNERVRMAEKNLARSLTETVAREYEAHSSQMGEIEVLLKRLKAQVAFLGNHAAGHNFLSEAPPEDVHAEKKPASLNMFVVSYIDMVGRSRNYIGAELSELSKEIADITNTLVGPMDEDAIKARGR
jgi:hypothetical protein